MSKFLCECGYIIHDHELVFSYKASLLYYKKLYDFFTWIVDEIQEYVIAVQK